MTTATKQRKTTPKEKKEKKAEVIEIKDSAKADIDDVLAITNERSNELVKSVYDACIDNCYTARQKAEYIVDKINSDKEFRAWAALIVNRLIA